MGGRGGFCRAGEHTEVKARGDTQSSSVLSYFATHCRPLFDHFSAELEGDQHYPPGAPDLRKNRLFATYHAKTPEHRKEVATKKDPTGVAKVVLASVAMGMGVDLKGVNPSSTMVLLAALRTISRQVAGQEEDPSL